MHKNVNIGFFKLSWFLHELLLKVPKFPWSTHISMLYDIHLYKETNEHNRWSLHLIESFFLSKSSHSTV